jgi:hypothetical protein
VLLDETERVLCAEALVSKLLAIRTFRTSIATTPLSDAIRRNLPTGEVTTIWLRIVLLFFIKTNIALAENLTHLGHDHHHHDGY